MRHAFKSRPNNSGSHVESLYRKFTPAPLPTVGDRIVNRQFRNSGVVLGRQGIRLRVQLEDGRIVTGNLADCRIVSTETSPSVPVSGS
jgi:hypothetical protein